MPLVEAKALDYESWEIKTITSTVAQTEFDKDAFVDVGFKVRTNSFGCFSWRFC
jgi:hypothetical protein